MAEPYPQIHRLAGPAAAQQSYCCASGSLLPWQEALCACQEWFAQNLGRFVEGYHLETAPGQVGGHLYYALTPQALVAYHLPPGRFAVLYCEWVQLPLQGQGLGRRLFDHFLAEMKLEQAGGILAETAGPQGKRAEWIYLQRGFVPVCEQGPRRLLYLPLAVPRLDAAPLPARLVPTRQRPVEIVILNGCPCPYDVTTQLLLRRVAQEFGAQVNLRQDWLTPETLLEYGAAGGMFINGRQKLLGGEPEEAVRMAILEELS